MTIKLAVSLSNNLSHPNKVINFDRPINVLNNCVGVSIDFYSEKNDKKAMYSILSFVAKTIGNEYPNFSPWLFISNSTWQPNNRIVKYNRLLNSEFIKGVNLKSISYKSCEYFLEKDGKIKFANIMLLSNKNLEKVVEVFNISDIASYLVFFNSEIDQEYFFGLEWSGIIYKDIELINILISKNGILIKMLEYDHNKEISFVILGKEDILKNFYFNLILNKVEDDISIIEY